MAKSVPTPKVGSGKTPPPITRAEMAPNDPHFAPSEMHQPPPQMGRHQGQSVGASNTKARPK